MTKTQIHRCIFCERMGLTREHLFADWLRVLFPRSATDTHNHGVTTWGQSSSGRIYAMPTLTVHQGHSGSRKVKCVCGPCNNGWMSRLETRTRPILMPLIQGNFHRVSPFDQKTLASWITKTIMVAEFLFPERVTIPDADRLRMYASAEPSENWKIWIAGYQGLKWRNLAIGYQGPSIAPTPRTG
jgi:hypothetical protein